MQHKENMNGRNGNIVNDLKNLIHNYIPEADAKEFLNIIDEDISLKNKTPVLSEPEKTHVEYEPPEGVHYRILVDKVITRCEKVLEEEKYYKLILDLSQLLLFEGENAFSLELAENLLVKITSSKNHLLLKAEANLMISKIYWAQAYWDDCNYCISEAMNIFHSLSDKNGIAKCENMLGTLYGEKGLFSEAKEHFEKALVYLKEENDILSHAMVLTNLGIIDTICGNFELAVWNYKNSIEKFKSINDTRRLSRVYHNTGMLFTQMENYDAALDEFNKCITLSLGNDYLSNCAIAYIGKAYIYTKLDNSSLADAYTDKAMEIAYKINDTLSIADIYKIKGIIQNNMENFQLSEELFENSIRLNKDNENKLNEAESSAEMGKLLEKNQRKKEAEKYTSEAEEYFKEIQK